MNISPKLRLFDKDCTYSLRGVAILAVMLHHCYIMSVTKMGMPDFYSPFGRELGSYSVAIFFMLSGYGMFLSMRKTNTLSLGYLYNHLMTLIVPFVFVFILRLFIFTTLSLEIFGWHNITDLLTFTMPGGGEMWFAKIIICVYVISFVILKCFKKDYVALSILLLLSVAYYGISRYIHQQDYWYATIFNFVVGMMLAQKKEKLNPLYLLAVCVPAFLFFYHYQSLTLSGISFSLSVISVISYVDIRNKTLEQIGYNSWLFYISHYLCLILYPIYFHYIWMYPFFVILFAYCFVLFYNKIVRPNLSFILS